MVSKIICSNTSPLWHLGSIKEKKGEEINGIKIAKTSIDIDVLAQIYSEIIIPKKVQEEILQHRKSPKASKSFVRNISKVASIKDQALVDYLIKQYMRGESSIRNRGECETFVLATEKCVEALVANEGAEKMFDSEKSRGICVEYISLIPFGEKYWQDGNTTEDDFKKFLEALYALGYRPDLHEDYFQLYGII
ncbi:MAG: hypothetical protein KAT43_05055 [Nanoarchaeota archaeon]|nr:hypothetical protein [Nanoarchaeota archaeon]